VPLPGDVVPERRVTDRRADVEVESVQPAVRALHLCQETPALIPDSQDPLLDQDLVVVLIQLAKADNVGRELGDEVHSRQPLMLASLAGEEDRAAPLDADHRPVAEPDGAVHAGVEVGEG